MDVSRTIGLKDESDNVLKASSVVKDSTINNLTLDCGTFGERISVNNYLSALGLSSITFEGLLKPNEIYNFADCKNNSKEIPKDYNVIQNSQTSLGILGSAASAVPDSHNYFNSGQNKADHKASNEESKAIIKVFKPLCADYRSGSDTESVDSESDSSTLSTGTTTSDSDSESESSDSKNSGSPKRATKLHVKKKKSEVTLLDLPPIEELRISVPEEACVEIGTITSFVDTLVVVESYKGTAALDLDTVLFLDSGKKTLGKVFEILGPINEPVYVVRFNTQEDIKSHGLEKGLKVYFAPKTEHTKFVFMSEVLKIKGTDASWKDNTEAPPEFQDFSDDEEERMHNKKQNEEFSQESSVAKDPNGSRKRNFCNIKETPVVAQPNTFKKPSFFEKWRPNFQATPSNNQFMASPSFPRANVPGYPRAPLFPNLPCPPRFSGFPFPTFGGLPHIGQNQNFRQPFYQQRTHPFFPAFGPPWGAPMFGASALPPPPPPPPPPPLPPRPLPHNQSGQKPETEMRLYRLF